MSVLQHKLRDNRVTRSLLNCFGDCPRKAYYSYARGLRPVKDHMALRLGSAVHMALDLRAKGAPEAEVIERTLAKFDEGAPSSGDAEAWDQWLIERERLYRMIGGYYWRWADEAVEYIESEIPHNVKIVNPETGHPMRVFTKAGVIDKLVRVDGQLAILEHKTTSSDLSAEGDYMKRVRIDSQVSDYFIAARALGHDVEAIVYDVLRKPTMEPCLLTQAQTKQLVETGEYHKSFRKEEEPAFIGSYTVRIEGDVEQSGFKVYVDDIEATVDLGKRGFAIRETLPMYGDRISADMGRRPDHYFARQTMVRTEADLVEAQEVLHQEASMLHDANIKGRWPMRTRACVGFGRCQYFDLCTNSYDPDSPDAPSGFEFVQDVHQELAED